jgi:hypothetical protein
VFFAAEGILAQRSEDNEGCFRAVEAVCHSP